MRSLNDQLSQYARYHRDRHNVLTHFIGIPLIVLAIAILLSKPALFAIGGLTITPAVIVAGVLTLYYLKLDLAYGLVMAAFLTACISGAAALTDSAQAPWLAWGIGLFVIGWIFQFIGHLYEGRKPAFFDDLLGLIIGPLFIIAEAGFLLGWRKEIEAEIAATVG